MLAGATRGAGRAIAVELSRAGAFVEGFEISETPTYVARGVAALAADPDLAHRAGQVLTAHQLAIAPDPAGTGGQADRGSRLASSSVYESHGL